MRTGLSDYIVYFSLNLSHKRVHSIPANVFRPLTFLEKLFLSGNRISTVDQRDFSGLLKLKLLTLQNNLVTRIPTAALQSMSSLSSPTLDKIPLIKIRPLDASYAIASMFFIFYHTLQ